MTDLITRLEQAEAGSRDPVRAFVEAYEFRGDGGDYTPTDNERDLIEDAIHAWISEQAHYQDDQSAVANYSNPKRGSITASCGHKVSSADDLVSVEYEDEHCDAVEGFVPVTVYAEYCPSCAERLRAIKEGEHG